MLCVTQKPIRRGVVGPTLMLEEVGRRKVYYGVNLYLLLTFKWFYTMQPLNLLVNLEHFQVAVDACFSLFTGCLRSTVFQSIGWIKEGRSKFWRHINYSFLQLLLECECHCFSLQEMMRIYCIELLLWIFIYWIGDLGKCLLVLSHFSYSLIFLGLLKWFFLRITFGFPFSYLMRWLTINWFLKIACATAGEAQKWLEAFDQAKQQVRQVL